MYVALQYAASFHCLVEEWKDCEELKPKPKESGFLSENEASNRVVCGSRQVSMYEIWKRKQIHEDARRCTCSGKWRRRHLGGHEPGQKSGQTGRS